jgi:tetratricopeptide (TPR) repeat protein
MLIFLSHSSADRAACDAFVRDLRGAGADVWYDEHNLGAGELIDEIQRELRRRPVFVVLLSPDALVSKWVVRECKWAYTLADADPSHIILPVVVRSIEPKDLNATMLFLSDFKRIEGPNHQPYAQEEAISRTLKLLALTENSERRGEVVPQPAESLDNLLTQGWSLFAQERYAEALPYFECATQVDASAYEAWAGLGRTLEALGRNVDSLAASERAIALNPTHASAWLGRGNALYGLRRYNEALAAYERALEIDPNFAAAWNGKANTLRKSGRLHDALVAYDGALTLDPTLAFTWNDKGSVLFGLKRYDEALVAYELALALDRDFAVAWNGKGNALFGLNQLQEALAAYDRALTLDPAYANAWHNKSILLDAMGQTDDADAAEQQAKELGG